MIIAGQINHGALRNAPPRSVQLRKIADLMRGKIARFSLDTLVNMLTDAGIEVQLTLKSQPKHVA